MKDVRMTEEIEEKTTRLLDIIESVINQESSYFEKKLPYQVNTDGEVIFDKLIITELSKPENFDLIEWAHQNVVNLFQ